MAAPCAKYWSGTVADPNDGAVSAATSTSICPVVRSASPAWAAASTFTASFASAPSVPVWDSVSVALVPPAVAVAEPMEIPETPVTSSKLDAPTPLANVVSDSSDTVTVAPFSVAAVEDRRRRDGGALRLVVVHCHLHGRETRRAEEVAASRRCR